MLGKGELPRAIPSAPPPADEAHEERDDLRDVHGQESARRALEIAAAGQHNLLMLGPPGAGKTMLARRLPGLLPALSQAEALDVAAIHSVAGLLGAQRVVPRARPFRAPHHTVSEVGLVGGGGERVCPGEVTLAHHGVLFLDELAEFRRGALEALRQPLEDGFVTVSRAHTKATFPARPLVVGAMNPCPCGHLGDGSNRCACTRERIRAYRSRLSGPLLDRLDVHVSLAPVSLAALQRRTPGESTRDVRTRVEAARAIQRGRFDRGETIAPVNSALSTRDLERIATPCEAGQRLLGAAVTRLGLTARAYGKVLRVARTIADLEAAHALAPAHLAEAIGLRVLDRGTAAPATAA
ncbi:MAG TPA: YifB family Mg chelatase-like AAA ATPase [Byssovorax sp.]